MLRRIGRARPPESLSADHDQLLALLRVYVAAQVQLFDAVSRREHDRALSLATDYVRAAGELKAAVDALYARARS